MKAKSILASIFFFLVIPFVSAGDFNFSNIISINIPPQFEILSYNQGLSFSGEHKQCWYNIAYEFVCVNRLFTLEFSLYGNSELSSAIDLLQCPGKDVADYSVRFGHAGETEILLKKYKTSSAYTITGHKYSFLGTLWPSGVTSDFIGYYLKIKNKVFDECFVFLFNSWARLGAKNELYFIEGSFSDQLKKEDRYIQEFYSLIERIIKSLQFNASSRDPIPFSRNYSAYARDGSLYAPTAEKIGLREKPSIASNVVGVVSDKPYRIVGIGKETTVNGKKGYWIRITPAFGDSSIGWTFSQYFRKMTEAEVEDFYGGFN